MLLVTDDEHHKHPIPFSQAAGGSVMMAVPPAFLDLLHLRAGASVGMTVDSGRLVVEPKPRPRYTLAELLAASDYSQPQPPDQREWVDAPAVGAELV